MNIAALPFNRFIGIERSTVDGGVLALPENERYTNHLGTVHASALLALAEATSGEFVIATLAGLGVDVIPVVRRIEAKFRKPANGAVYSKFGDIGDSKSTFLDALSKKGRALIKIPVDIFDDTGAHALTASVEWFVAQQNENRA